jgi:hypothetical protein
VGFAPGEDYRGIFFGVSAALAFGVIEDSFGEIFGGADVVGAVLAD